MTATFALATCKGTIKKKQEINLNAFKEGMAKSSWATTKIPTTSKWKKC
jgi:hypothetical protein